MNTASRPRALRALPALLVLLLALAARPAAGAPLRGIAIRAGDTAASALSPAGDVDTFVFDAFGGSLLTVSLGPGKASAVVPTLAVLDPGGAALDLEGFVRTKKAKTTVKKLPLPETGRYAIVVAGGGTRGTYTLKTKVAEPKKRTEKDREIAAGGTLDIAIPGRTDVALKIAVKDRGGGGFEVLGVLDPDGVALPGAREAFVTKKGAATGTVILNGRLGDFLLRLGGTDAATRLDVTVKSKFPKVKRRKLEISPVEPTIAALEPAFARPGDSIDILGEGFAAGDGLEVRFGERPADHAEWKSDTLIRARVPDGSGSVPVTVYNPDGQSGASETDFTFLPPPPAIATAVPDFGPDTGGTIVAVFGEDLGRVREVTLGGAVLSTAPEVIDDTHLRFTTDAHAAGTAVLVLTDEWGQQHSLNGAFTFYGEPVVESLAPASGSVAGRTTVTVTGRWLRGDDRVLLDGVPALSVAADGFGGLLVTTPPHAPGKVDVTIEDPWGRSRTFEDAFEYTEAGFDDLTPTLPSNLEDLVVGGCAVAIGDLDGDLDADIVLGRSAGGGGKVVALTNGGDEGFRAAALPLPTGNVRDELATRSLALGDLDGDGDLDLVVTCDERFREAGSVTYWTANSPFPYVGYDRPQCSTRVLLNDGRGGFAHAAGALPDARTQGADLLQGDSVALGDVDGDDDLDIVLTRRSSVGETAFTTATQGNVTFRYFRTVYRDDRPATRVLLNDGSGTFSDDTASALPGVGSGDMFAGERTLLGDVDGDSDLDILLTGDDPSLRDEGCPEYVKGSKTRLLRNDGAGGFTNVTADAMPEPGDADDWGGVAAALGDLDGDGRLDLAITTGRVPGSSGEEEAARSSTRIFLGGANGFVEATGDWMPAGGDDTWRGRDVAIADPEGDGCADLFIVHEGQILVRDPESGDERQISSLRWLASSGVAPFRDMTATSLPDPEDRDDYLLGHALAFGDLDGDDDLDLVLTTELDEYLEDGRRPTRLLRLD